MGRGEDAATEGYMDRVKALAAAGLAMLGSAMLGSAAQAEPTIFARVEPWTIHRNVGNCAMSALYPRDQVIINIRFDQVLDSARVTITDERFKSIEDGRKYTFRVTFVGKSGIDDAWGTANATGLVLGTARAIQFGFRGRDFLKDIAANDVFAIYRDDLIVESLSLKGSAAAVSKLKECARLEAVANPSDPLEGM